MLPRIWSSLRRDSLIAWRNGFVALTLLVAFFYIAAVRWLIPAETALKPDVYVIDRTAGGHFAAQTQAVAAAETVRFFDEEGALTAAMEANENSVGVVLDEGAPLPAATLYFQKHQNDRVRQLLAISVEEQLRQLYGAPLATAPVIQTEVLRGSGAESKTPFNELWVPILLFSDTAMIGLLFIAALIFIEKDEGTMRAYQVTPGRTWELLLAKALALALLGLLFTLLFVPLSIGAGPNYLHLLLLMAAGSLMGSLIGAWLAAYFDNFNQFLFPGLAVMVTLTLPSIAYFAPGFSPLWLRLLPSYPLVFGLREALFPSGSPQVVLAALATLLAIDAALLLVSSTVFNRRLARHGEL
jgi:ABC-type Na+ efflux pump permease subunit